MSIDFKFDIDQKVRAKDFSAYLFEGEAIIKTASVQKTLDGMPQGFTINTYMVLTEEEKYISVFEEEIY